MLLIMLIIYLILILGVDKALEDIKYSFENIEARRNSFIDNVTVNTLSVNTAHENAFNRKR